MIKDIKRRGRAILVKYNLLVEQEVKRAIIQCDDQESGEEDVMENPAVNLICEAINLKVDIIPHLNHKDKILVLQFVPTNAAVSFDM